MYGRGPVMKALPDIRTANTVVEMVLKNASIAATGIWQAEDDGVLNPATVRLVPGAIIRARPIGTLMMRDEAGGDAHLRVGTRILGLLLVTMDGKQGADLLERVRPHVTVPVHYNDYTVFRSPLEDFRAEYEENLTAASLR